MAILLRTAMSVQEQVGETGEEELIGDVADLVESLRDRLEHYESALGEHGIRLPYSPIKEKP